MSNLLIYTGKIAIMMSASSWMEGLLQRDGEFTKPPGEGNKRRGDTIVSELPEI